MFTFSEFPYESIKLNFNGKVQNNSCSFSLDLPLMITKFMRFKETEALVFKHKWSVKKDQMISTEIITFDKQIVRKPEYFLKYLPHLIELTD